MISLLPLLISCASEGPEPGPHADSPADSEFAPEDTAHDYVPCSDEPYVDVEAGFASGCARRADGCLDCWVGPKPIYYWEEYGVESPPDDHFASVSLSGGGILGPCASEADPVSHPELGACGVTDDGELMCWGYWHPDTSFPSVDLDQVSVGYTHACALDAAGQAYCWGACEHGECEVGEGPYTSIVAAQSFSCGLRTDGTVDCWGVDSDLNCMCWNDEGCVASHTTMLESWSQGPYDSLFADAIEVCGRTGSTVSCFDYYDLFELEAPLDATLPTGVEPRYVILGFEFVDEVCGVDETGELWCEQLTAAASRSGPFIGRLVQDVDADSAVCMVTTDGQIECSFDGFQDDFCPFCDEIWVE